MRIENVKIVNHDKTIENADIEISNGKINKIIEKSGKAKLIIIPGLIDTHTHGMMGFDVMDGKDALENIAKLMANSGTTTFLPTLMTAKLDDIKKTLIEITNSKYTGANIPFYHIEGPFISHEKKGAHDPKLLLKGTKKIFDSLEKASNGKLRKYVLAPESTSSDLVKYLVSKKIFVSIGHSNAVNKAVDEYVEAGASICTHIWNGMSGVTNRAPGIVEKFLLNDLFVELICDFVHVDKEAIKLTIKNKGIDKIQLITDSIRPAGLKDGDSISGGLPITKKGLLITLKESGNIAGGGSLMIDQFKNFVSLGYSLNNAVQVTSTNQSMHLGLNKGQIKEGYDADFLIIDENIKIKNIYIEGEKWR